MNGSVLKSNSKTVTRSTVKSALKLTFFAIAFGLGCTTSEKEVHEQAYAKLKTHRDYEYPMKAVWGGIEAALRRHKVLSRDPESVGDLEWKDLSERIIETDWIYGRSEDKFVKYEVNNLPKKKYLQMRYKYIVTAKKKFDSTQVDVESFEEVEHLYEDSSSAGYEPSKAPDSRKANRLLDEIKIGIQAPQ